jgi:hypothetical protein
MTQNTSVSKLIPTPSSILGALAVLSATFLFPLAWAEPIIRQWFGSFAQNAELIAWATLWSACYLVLRVGYEIIRRIAHLLASPIDDWIREQLF